MDATRGSDREDERRRFLPEEAQARTVEVWKSVLGLPQVELDDNFFEAGGTSLLAATLLDRMNHAFSRSLPIAAVFEFPTVRSMTEHWQSDGDPISRQASSQANPHAAVGDPSGAIAIIAMTGRFPGAASVEAFWHNLAAGVESVSFFSRQELENQFQADEPGFVAARPILENAAMFDAGFFGIYPKEAEQMDPQHRIFLECAWELLERAGYDPGHTEGAVGVFAGCSMNTYFMQNLASGRDYLEQFTAGYQVGSYVTMLGNDKDFLATRVAYKLNLRGPAITVQCACSTSLVAVCQACESLVARGCDMALAGAVSITFPQKRGYLPQEGGLASLDGHCRPFDAHANGTVFGHGAACVLLKRFEDAQRDGDQILGVIRGWAVNNDGSAKVGYTAPGIDGQAGVITRARQMANVPVESITYVEAHGTGTPLGDPIEVAALTKAFRSSTAASGFCSLGTAKANVGHLDVAAGATGLIKTLLQFKHRQIPGLLHFESPNPHIDLAHSPFFVQKRLAPWRADRFPLRAGVSAFGVGGTNAHVIVEQPPAEASRPAASEPREDVERKEQWELLTWSAKSASAASTIGERLAGHFHQHADLSLADAAYTLQMSRSRHKHRRALVAASLREAQALLLDAGSSLIAEDHPFANPGIVFCFPGQGVQSPGMGRGLYQSEQLFRDCLDRCDEILRPHLGESLLDVLYPTQGTAGAAERLNQTQFAQPAIFAFEYALAQLWLSWGIHPTVMIGHSVGEFAAACLAGVFSLEDGLAAIAARGRIMQQIQPGAMLAVRASEESVLSLMPDTLDLAAVNSTSLTVVSGEETEISSFSALLDSRKIPNRKLHTSHAFHSRMIEPAVEPFRRELEKIRFQAPSIPYISTVTGRPVTAEEATTPKYWAEQIRRPVRFRAAALELLRTSGRIYLEVGPQETASQILRQCALEAGAKSDSARIVPSLAGRHGEQRDEQKLLLTALGRVWAAGAEPDWRALHAGKPRRVLLPTYPFERKLYWATPPTLKPQLIAAAPAATAAPPAPLNAISSATKAAMPTTENPEPLSAAPASSSMLNEIKLFITDLSGTELADVDGSASFLELGFDSLFLTQLTQAIQAKYHVKLTFRQIMESFPTLDALAEHLGSQVPASLRAAPAIPVPQPAAAATMPAPEAPAAPLAAAAPLAPAVLPAATPSSSLEVLFAAQTQALANLFAQQMSLLQRPALQQAPGAAVASTNAVAAAPPPIAHAPAPGPLPAATTVSAMGAAPAIGVASAKSTYTPFKPLARGTSGGLTPEQNAYLHSFIDRYNKKTPASKSYTQQYRSVFAGGRVVAGFHALIKEMVYPLVVDRASGAYLWDKDGNRYIDILNGFGAILYGHSPDFILEAVHRQLDIGFPIGPQTELAGECSALIREMTGMDRVVFCNTGSEAVMNGMRVARTVTGRNLIAVFAGDYHGSFDEVLVKAAGHRRSMPIAPGIPRESVANMIVLEYGAEQSLEILRQRAGELAAVLVEPVQSRHPALRPAEFVHEIRRITEQSGSALFFDEVVTGFRTHPGGMQAVYGVRADLATYGKVVAGGLPIGVLSGKKQYMDALDGGQWQYGDDSFPEVGVTFCAGTFVRHPLAMAAVKASLEHLKAAGGRLQQELGERTQGLVGDLQALFQKFGYPANLEGFSSWFYFGVPPEPRLARLLHFHLREKGIHIQEGFPCFLTTAHTDADLDFIRNAFRESLEEMQAGHALEAPESEQRESVTAAKTASGPDEQIAVKPSPEPSEFPITEPQREILLGTQLGTEANCAFNESTSLTLAGPLDRERLVQALETVVARHDALRSTIDLEGDTVHVLPRIPIPLTDDDLTGLTEDERGKQRQKILYEEASTPFDLVAGPLFRVRLVALAAEEHVLVFTAHHIAFDGWSTNVLYSELSQLYNGDTQLADPPRFSDYALAEGSQASSAAAVEAEAFWLKQFETIPAPLDLPLDRPRPALRTNGGSSKRYIVDTSLAQAVRKAGARQGSTLFATLLAAYTLLIQKLTQQRDAVVGVPMAGQSQVENGSSLVGHCVHFLPIRSSYGARQSLSDFLKQIRKALLDAQDHQSLTYGTLLRKLRISRDPSRLQLVEVQFNLEQLGSGVQFDHLSASLEANAKTSVNMDLFFNFVDRGGQLWLDVDYNRDLLDETTIDRWVGHLQAILQAIAENTAQTLAEVSLLSSAEADRILTAWNQTETDYPRTSSIHRVFEEQARRTPDHIAVQGRPGLTYAALNAKANQLARSLGAAGVRPGDRVGLCMERSTDSIIGLLAILKAGAAYVPIDPSYPAPRLAYMVHDSGIRILLADQSTTSSLPSLPVDLLSIGELRREMDAESSDNLSFDRAPEQEAYLMYTSGSTGEPKGVLIPHRAVLRLVKNSSFASFAPEEVFLQLAPLSFDAATFEIWGPLLNGARLAIGPSGRITPEEIGRAIQTDGVTTVWLTAALFHLMVSEHLELLRPLHQLLAGGDIVSPAHVRRALEAMPGLRLINGYGPTENTTFTCCHSITLASLGSGTVPIGKPISNTRIYLLDPAMKPVAPGVAGELYAAGDGLALGYLNAPELTSTKFLEHTFANGRRERLYRTGDLARYRADGTVEFIGRADTQVKVRGYRIELGEIERALERSPLVRSAVVAVRTDWVAAADTPGDKRLAAYVVPEGGGDRAALIQQLRQYLKEQLPEYMQPAAIMVLDSLPRTLNGKVDRRALPAPKPEQALRQHPMVYPRSPEEEKLAQIWAEVLGLKEVGVEDSIFELGGDSLLIFRITTLANQRGLKLTARHIFEHRTIAKICSHLNAKTEEGVLAAAGGIKAQPRDRYRRTVLNNS